MRLTTVDSNDAAAQVTLLTVTMPEKLAAAAGIQPAIQVAVLGEAGSDKLAGRDVQGAVCAVDALLRIRFGIGE